MFNYIYIDTKEKLKEAAETWKENKVLAIDLECENNLHHYGAYITLIQISDKDHNWVIDVLRIKNIKPLINILEDSDIGKIFHDVSFDFRILYDQFRCHPRPVFDTQLAALLLGKENLGLGALLEEYMEIKKESKFQMADWTLRPLQEKMLAYAVKDTLYLIELKGILEKELKEKGRLSWAEEEFRHLDEVEFRYSEQDFLDVRNVKELSQKQLGIFKKLFQLRKKIARMVDRPVHFIINNKRLLEFAVNPPDWKNLHGVHPVVRQSAELFKKAVEEGKEEPIPLEKSERKHLTSGQKDFLEKLNEAQKKASENLGIRGHLIVNKEQAMRLANKDYGCLRKWQKDVLEREGLDWKIKNNILN